MANEIFKQIKTRIALRTGDYAYWTTGAGKDIELLKGEVCICTVAKADNQAQTAPTVLFKVCDTQSKKFADLDWCSALAADVYEWAKKSEEEFITWVNTVVEHPAAPVITTGNANGTIAVDGTDVAVKGLGSAAYTDAGAYATSEQGTKADNAAATIATYGDIVTHNASEFAPHDIDTGVHSVALAGGTNNGTLKLTVDGEAIDNIAVTGLGDAAYTTVEALNATAKGYADGKDGAIAEAKQAGIDAANALDAYSELHEGDYNNTKIDELVQGAKDYADANDANTEYHVEYDSTNKKIKLVAGADASKMEIDATAFIKDGMIESVELVQEDASGNKGQFLKLTWNDDGNDITYVPVGELVDVYTGSTGDEINVVISNTNVVSASLNSAIATKIAHGEEAYGWGNHANAGYAKAADLGDLAGKDKIVEGDIDGTIAATKITNFATEVAGIKVTNAGHADNADKATDADKLGGQLPAYYASAESVTDIVEEGGTIDSKITAYNASKKFGDIITHNASEFATSEQGGKADTALQEITTTEGHGLKVTNKNNIDIDTDIIFVLDCNW